MGKKPAFKLRKAIHPKNPILLLNEMMAGNKAAVKYEFYDVPVRERERRAWYQGVGVEQVHTVYLGSGGVGFLCWS